MYSTRRKGSGPAVGAELDFRHRRLAAAGYDIGTCDCMNRERHCQPALPSESAYRLGDNCPIGGASVSGRLRTEYLKPYKA